MAVTSNTISALLEKHGNDRVLNLCGLHGASHAFLLATAIKQLRRHVCCILPTDQQLEIVAQDIRVFSDIEVVEYPSFEIPPYTPLSPDPTTVTGRISTLHRLLTNPAPCIILTSAEAILRRILPKNVLGGRSELVMAGEETDRDSLIKILIENGYQSCSMVQQVGDIAVRGSIVDIYAPATDEGSNAPLRLDFFGDTVESIRLFDPISQRSIQELEETVILPCSDILFPPKNENSSWHVNLKKALLELPCSNKAAAHTQERLQNHIRFAGIEFFLPLLYPELEVQQTLFDYLPSNCLIIQSDPTSIKLQTGIVSERIYANYDEATNTDIVALAPDSLFLTEDNLKKTLQTFQQFRLHSLPDPESTEEYHLIKTGEHTLLKQEIKLQGKKRGILAPLADRIIKWKSRGEKVFLTCRSMRQARQFDEMLQRYHLQVSILTAPIDISLEQNTNLVELVDSPLSQGFDLTEDKLHILAAHELFGEKRIKPSARKTVSDETSPPVLIEELECGDIVVHKEHGLGIFNGLLNMQYTGQQGDFMQIEYRDKDKLYVPVDRLHWVTKYQGLTEQQPRLDRLGTDNWLSTKKKVTDAVWEVAHELIEIYAKRELKEGHRFSAAGELFHELEQSFPYEETEGQNRAINEVLDDLTSEQPTDRLVCGDVGYGKTEVAVRAAFKVIEDGYQVAVLVPTTVLAEQHAATFRERYDDFPVKVSCLNRFRTSSQQKKIVKKIQEGKVDLVIGTHRILSKDIKFAKLGLLIIDEEHRFGVTHKEKIKKIKAEVDVLTLTATPIPRTLQMSLLGIRDLSVISTPPRRRRSVKTFLAKNDDLVIREAIIRELQRGGQLYFVHNRVRSIHRIAEKVEELVPHARVAVAHGQMPGRELENIMIKFINHEVDVLVCTTIIESGLDIPNANTIIINRADRFGLADAYQLRGRVGRSSIQSYAYLLVPSLESLTKDAKQRLRALMDCNELGGGFKLAMNDLQIRGGGNLLGVSQSGHIAAVGYDLYLELLQSTVTELKKKGTEQDTSVEIDLDPVVKLNVSAFIPDDYINDPSQRYQMYKRISTAGNTSLDELDSLRDELLDRYGQLPKETDMLLDVIQLKYPLRKLGISKLEQGPETLAFSFVENTPVSPDTLLAFITKKTKNKKNITKLTPDQRLIVPLEGQKNLFNQINAIVNALSAS